MADVVQEPAGRLGEQGGLPRSAETNAFGDLSNFVRRAIEKRVTLWDQIHGVARLRGGAPRSRLETPQFLTQARELFRDGHRVR